MKHKFLTIEWAGPVAQEFNMLCLPRQLALKTNLEEDKPYVLKIGALISHIYIKKVSDGPSNKLWCSELLYKSCNIPAGTTLTLKVDNDDTLRLGPLIGLLTVQLNDGDNPFGKQSKFLRALYDRASKINCLVYAFAPQDISYEEGIVYGYIPLDSEPNETKQQSSNEMFNENTLEEMETVKESESTERWARVPLPYPDLVYNRIFSRFWESQEPYCTTLNNLKDDLQNPFFNPGFLDKWDVHQKLSQIHEVNTYLPKTIYYETPDDIIHFTGIYPDVFLKPCSGSLGRRIIRVTKTNTGFHYRFRKSNGEIAEGDCTDVQELVYSLRHVMGERPYIIQQSIPLARYEGQEFDVRLLMQKDRYGRWRRTKTYVRIVQPGSFTANLSTGAAAKSIVDVIRSVYGEDYEDKNGIGSQIRVAAEQIAEAIEKSFPGIWAELGIDFGIDVQGRVWLIEANSKPFKALVGPSGVTRRIEMSFLRPLEFAKFLLGFYPHSM